MLYKSGRDPYIHVHFRLFLHVHRNSKPLKTIGHSHTDSPRHIGEASLLERWSHGGSSVRACVGDAFAISFDRLIRSESSGQRCWRSTWAWIQVLTCTCTSTCTVLQSTGTFKPSRSSTTMIIPPPLKSELRLQSVHVHYKKNSIIHVGITCMSIARQRYDTCTSSSCIMIYYISIYQNDV